VIPGNLDYHPVDNLPFLELAERLKRFLQLGPDVVPFRLTRVRAIFRWRYHFHIRHVLSLLLDFPFQCAINLFQGQARRVDIFDPFRQKKPALGLSHVGGVPFPHRPGDFIQTEGGCSLCEPPFRPRLGRGV